MDNPENKLNNGQILELMSRELIENMGNKLTEAMINGLLLKFNRFLPLPVIEGDISNLTNSK